MPAESISLSCEPKQFIKSCSLTNWMIPSLLKSSGSRIPTFDILCKSYGGFQPHEYLNFQDHPQRGVLTAKIQRMPNHCKAWRQRSRGYFYLVWPSLRHDGPGPIYLAGHSPPLSLDFVTGDIFYANILFKLVMRKSYRLHMFDQDPNHFPC